MYLYCSQVLTISDTEGQSAVSFSVNHFGTFRSDCSGPNNSVQFPFHQ